MNFSVASVGSKNNNTYKIEYKAKTASAWTSIESGNSYAVNKNIVTGAIFGADSSFELRLTVSDYFSSISKIVELPTAFTLLDFNASGRALAFGKVSEIDNAVEFALRAQFSHAETLSSVKHLDSGQDLNNLLEAGFYLIPSTAIAATILNKPYTSTATANITVMKSGDSGQTLQICHIIAKEGSPIWQRAYYSGSWGAWGLAHAGGGTVLWQGAFHMTELHTITLAERVSQQSNGIVLVFCRYYNNEVKNEAFHSFFVSKVSVRMHGGIGNGFFMTTGGMMDVVASKYLYIHDDKIVGQTLNDEKGTAKSGLVFDNSGFVLRYVIGV